jgi:hypothetical protein
MGLFQSVTCGDLPAPFLTREPGVKQCDEMNGYLEIAIEPSPPPVRLRIH